MSLSLPSTATADSRTSAATATLSLPGLPALPAVPGLTSLALPMLFIWYGLAMGSWAGRLPAIKQGLQLSHTQLSMVLLCVGIGAVLSPQVSAPLLARLGRLGSLRLAGLSMPVLMLLASLAPTLPLLMLCALLLGLAGSSFDIAMNGMAARHESAQARPMMSRLHACACAGGLAGVTLGGALAALQLTTAQQFSLLALPQAALLWLCLQALRDRHEDSDSAGSSGNTGRLRAPRFVLPNRRLALLGSLGMLGAIAEGSIGNWSILFMKEHFGASDAAAPLALSAFTLMMLVSRSLGDQLKARHGARALVCAGSLLAACGLGLALFAPGAALALAGFALAGLGLALVYPFVFSAAGKEGTVALASVATMTYAGGLMGPPMMGAIADGLGLQAALGTVALLALIMGLVASRARLLR